MQFVHLLKIKYYLTGVKEHILHLGSGSGILGEAQNQAWYPEQCVLVGSLTAYIVVIHVFIWLWNSSFCLRVNPIVF